MKASQIAVFALFFVQVIAISAADNPQVARIMAAYNAKLKALDTAIEKQRTKLCDDTIKKLKNLRLMKKRLGDSATVTAIDAKIAELAKGDAIVMAGYLVH